MSSRVRRFTTTVVKTARGRVLVPLPFEPDDEWGTKPSHPVAGSVNGMGVRAVVEPLDDGGQSSPDRRGGAIAGSRRAMQSRLCSNPKAPSEMTLPRTSPPRSTPRLKLPQSSTAWPSSTATPTCVGSTLRSAAQSSALFVSPRSSACSRPESKNGRNDSEPGTIAARPTPRSGTIATVTDMASRRDPSGGRPAVAGRSDLVSGRRRCPAIRRWPTAHSMRRSHDLYRPAEPEVRVLQAAGVGVAWRKGSMS